MSYLDGVDESERVAKEFWAASRRKRERREEHEAKLTAATGIGRFDEILRYVWGENTAALVSYEQIRFGPQDLDEWLAEDNPHRFSHFGQPGVLETLGLS
jgi:hypothetical protein